MLHLFLLIFHFTCFSDEITIANGVARPKLHGHATTNIVTNMFIAVAKFLLIANHIINAIIAIIIIVGTKYPLILSATFCYWCFSICCFYNQSYYF